MKLKTQITFFIILILIFSLGSTTFFSYFQMKDIFNEQLEKELFNIAYYAADDYMVKEALLENKDIPNSLLNKHIEGIRLKTEVDFIVAIDMDGIRLTHPNEKNIGIRIKGGDEIRVLEKAEEYVSKAVGTLGTSIRVFVPVFKDGKQIGAVSVGKIVTEIRLETNRKIIQFIPLIVFGLLLGISCAAILSSNIKSEILGLEPKEITLMFKESEAILDNVKEGIITLNEKGNLIQYNKEAKSILELTENDIGKNIDGIININMPYEALEYSKDLKDVEVKIRHGVTLLCNYNTIKNDNNQIIGHVVNFRDRTEVKKMAEELTGIKKMTWSLRAQNHEFMNKLHTISGLIQLGELDEAVRYISKTVSSRGETTKIITEIKNKTIEALLLSMYSKAEELRIELEIDKDSNLSIPKLLSEEELGSLIANLLENSIEAVNVDGTGKVYFKIYVKEGNLIIDIKDNGPGIPLKLINKIYEPRFSTKSDKRGYGMYIVKKIIDQSLGTIDLSIENGTSWHIKIPMESVKAYDQGYDN